METCAEVQTAHEELANSFTHGLGLVLSVTGVAFLIIMACLHATVWHIVSFSVYGASLILLYGASTIYHSLPSSTAKRILTVIDHAAIYFLIGGCYTPFTLVTLRGGWGWSLFGVIWAMTLLGILLKILHFEKSEKFCLFLYLAMGWLIVIALKPLFQALPLGGFLLLASGGIAYTLGVVFFKAEKMPFNHAIWHGFVLFGSGLHYLCMLLYVLPSRNF